MRDAVVHPDEDFMVPPAPRKPRARRKPVEPSRGEKAAAFLRRYPAESVISLILFGAAAAIIWNALALQTARHPSPLFGKAAPSAQALPAPIPPMRPARSAALPETPLPAEPAVAPSTVPAPISAPTPTPLPARPAARDPISEIIRTGESPAPRAQPAPPARPQAERVATPTRPSPPPAATAPARDPIGDLIRLSDPAPIPPGLVGRPETRALAAGQRALVKLGYGPLATDGIIGPGTRQAIERFERDRRLPVTGELGPRTARELSALSGIPID